MERLIGNFWFHDDGSGQVTLYERLGRRNVVVRAESEGLPERLPFETRKLIQELLNEKLKIAAERTPTDVKLSNLEAALAAFPGYEEMTEEAKEALKITLVGNRPELIRPPAPDPAPLPVHPTVEMQVADANRKAAEQLDLLAQRDTQILRLQAELAALKESKNNGGKEEVPKGQDASGPTGLLGEEARKEDPEQDDS